MDAAVTALTPTNEAALRAAAGPGMGSALAGPLAPLNRLQALPLRQKAMLAIGTAGLLALAVALALWSRQVPMTPLFSHTLPENEAGAVIEQLTKLGETFQLGTVGSLIMVPTERANGLRMKLATQGLPRSAPSGYELMDKPTFGQSSLQERTNLQRALGGRLEQQIATISAVQSVKVMVALTGQNGFFRDQDKPSASVALTLQPGRTLDRSQIAGIAHLTATGVPGLLAKAVTITDQDGNWLTQPDGEGRSDLTQQQRAHLRETEARLLKNVKEVLEPALGPDNLRATVTAELDFNQIESTSEAYGANKGADQKATVRSERSTEAGPSSSVQPSGVPGAASNQAGTAATAPVTGASAPLQAAQAGASNSGPKRESQVNYEVDKRVEMQRNAVGNIKRINVAVLVNHRSTTDAKGKSTSLALPPGEIEKLTALVQEAVGFKKERGDSVRVVNIPFRAEPKVEPEAVPVYRQAWLIDLIKVAGVPAALTLMALMLLFGVVRPALKKVTVEPLPVESKLNAVVDDTQALPLSKKEAQIALEAPRINKQLTDARQLAMENPAAVASILRGWVSGSDA
jgi:flagellar M-ring protein FliF